MVVALMEKPLAIIYVYVAMAMNVNKNKLFIV